MSDKTAEGNILGKFILMASSAVVIFFIWYMYSHVYEWMYEDHVRDTIREMVKEQSLK